MANLPWAVTDTFRKGISRADRCQVRKVLGVECIANRFPDVRGTCQADHVWPNSLGGPSVLENRLILCRFHNAMKSNDVAQFDWTRWPTWLRSYLELIARLKQ